VISGVGSYVSSTATGKMANPYMKAFTSGLINSYTSAFTANMFERFGGRDFGGQYSLDKTINVDTMSIAVEQSLSNTRIRQSDTDEERMPSDEIPSKDPFQGVDDGVAGLFLSLGRGLGQTMEDIVSLISSNDDDMITKGLENEQIERQIAEEQQNYMNQARTKAFGVQNLVDAVTGAQNTGRHFKTNDAVMGQFIGELNSMMGLEGNARYRTAGQIQNAVVNGELDVDFVEKVATQNLNENQVGTFSNVYTIATGMNMGTVERIGNGYYTLGGQRLGTQMQGPSNEAKTTPYVNMNNRRSTQTIGYDSPTAQWIHDNIAQPWQEDPGKALAWGMTGGMAIAALPATVAYSSLSVVGETAAETTMTALRAVKSSKAFGHAMNIAFGATTSLANYVSNTDNPNIVDGIKATVTGGITGYVSGHLGNTSVVNMKLSQGVRAAGGFVVGAIGEFANQTFTNAEYSIGNIMNAGTNNALATFIGNVNMGITNNYWMRGGLGNASRVAPTIFGTNMINQFEKKGRSR